jgi:hypothetical protein
MDAQCLCRLCECLEAYCPQLKHLALRNNPILNGNSRSAVVGDKVWLYYSKTPDYGPVDSEVELMRYKNIRIATVVEASFDSIIVRCVWLHYS